MGKSVFEMLFPEISQSLILYILIAILLFLVMREFNCWYWKINHRLKIQKNIDGRLDDIEELLKELSNKNYKDENAK